MNIDVDQLVHLYRPSVLNFIFLLLAPRHEGAFNLFGYPFIDFFRDIRWVINLSAVFVEAVFESSLSYDGCSFKDAVVTSVIF